MRAYLNVSPSLLSLSSVPLTTVWFCLSTALSSRSIAFGLFVPVKKPQVNEKAVPPQQRKYFWSSQNHLQRSFSTTVASSTGMSAPSAEITEQALRFVDIGANLLEERFTDGIYRGTFRHEPDLDLILRRASDVGVRRIILTAGTVSESRDAVKRAREWKQKYSEDCDIEFSCTVGVHPTRCKQEFEEGTGTTPDELLQELLEIALDGMKDGTVVSVGEIGLDYDRLQFCPKDIQHTYLVKQLQVLAAGTGLPLFLHNRSVGKDLYNVLQENRECWKAGGVVHSFDDSFDLADSFIKDLGLYIGLNGCSLRTEENLQVARELPLDRILLETDCPYCEVRNTHAGYEYVKTHFEAKAEKKFERGLAVKSRQEPCHVIQVAEIIAGVKGIPVRDVADATYDSAVALYKWSD